MTGGEVVGDIQTESVRYWIVPMQGGTHAVVEIKPGAYPNGGDIPLPPLPPGVERKGHGNENESQTEPRRRRGEGRLFSPRTDLIVTARYWLCRATPLAGGVSSE